jgi:hypothetical protein
MIRRRRVRRRLRRTERRRPRPPAPLRGPGLGPGPRLIINLRLCWVLLNNNKLIVKLRSRVTQAIHLAVDRFQTRLDPDLREESYLACDTS